MEGIDQAKGMIYQYIEEKVQLAQRCVDLVAGHQTELDTVRGPTVPRVQMGGLAWHID
jgi:hypothetical protein